VKRANPIDGKSAFEPLRITFDFFQNADKKFHYKQIIYKFGLRFTETV
jgi:hypothetical protein